MESFERTMNAFPSDFVPMENQVAGHKSIDGNNSIGLLKHRDGYVLKPITNKELGDREVNFYISITADNNEILNSLKCFIPKYFGTITLCVHGQDVKFIKFEDLCFGLNKPCVMDIKIGRQTWHPSAPESKKETERKKYVETKKEFGFCIPGYQVYNVGTGELIKRGKDFGKSLTKETLPNAIREFLNNESFPSSLLCKSIEAQLNKILSWFKRQNMFHFYSSSILLLYDALKLEKHNGSTRLEGLDFKHQKDSWIRVYMIDFPHVCTMTNGELDQNYLFGLNKLIELLKNL